MNKPTDRELGVFLREVTGRMPGMPYTDRAVRIVRTAYNGADRFEVTWRDPDNQRRKLWYPNWRHAVAAAKWVNKGLEAANGKTAFTFNDAADSLVLEWERRNRSKHSDLTSDSLYAYRGVLKNHVRPKFGPLPLGKIKSTMIEEWLLEQAETASFDALCHRRNMVSFVLDHAARREWIDVNPLMVRKVKIPAKPTKRAHIPHRSDMTKLRTLYDMPRGAHDVIITWSNKRVLLVLGGSCGMRAGECAALRWDQIDPDTGEISIIASLARLAGRKVPKTEASDRKIPTTHRAREVLEEHAMVTRELYGRVEGGVLKTRSGTDFTGKHNIHTQFREIMRDVGLFNEDGSLKFSFHALRHWCASHWIKSTGGDIHRVSKWLGHKNASMTLDRYGHCLDDPESREKFERMPDWLEPMLVVEPPTGRGIPALPAPANGEPGLAAPEVVECPIHIPRHAERWVRAYIRDLWQHGNQTAAQQAVGKTRKEVARELQRLQLPTIGELQDMMLGETTIPEPITKPEAVPPVDEFPIDIPDSAAPWVKVYIQLLDQGLSARAAASGVHKAEWAVKAELDRLKLPTPGELKRRRRDKRIMHWHGQHYQPRDIARKVGCDVMTVYALLKSLHKADPAKLLIINEKLGRSGAGQTQPAHKTQLKLL